MPIETQEWSEQKLWDAINRVAAKAATDSDLRRKALNDPAAAILEVVGKPLPPGYKLRFVDNAGADTTVVLPDSQGGDELSDEELEEAAGGAIFVKTGRLSGDRTSRFGCYPVDWKASEMDGKSNG